MISQIHTPCKLCIFANYNGASQTSCALNRLDLMKKHDIEILEVYDDEKEFFVINNAKCLYWRYTNWPYADKPLEEQKTQIVQETIVPHHAIVFANNNNIDTVNTVRSLYNQTIKPCKITIVRKQDCELLPSELAAMFSDLDIPWRIENIMIKQSDSEIVDFIVPFVDALVYSVYYAGFIVPPMIFEEVNTKICDEFIHFIMLLPNKSNNGLMISQKIHKLYGGNKDMPLKTKLELDDCPHIVPVSTIITSFPNE